MKLKRPVLLAILDGWGVAPPGPGNAVHLAHTPNMDGWQQRFPATTLTAHNGAVGLPEGQMGNSEVGHLNIGAGRIVYQDFTRINKAIEDKSFFANPVLCGAMDKARRRDAKLHLMGLVSDGGVHSHLDHLVALLELAAARGVEKVFVHAFMDGRDTPPDSGKGYMEQLVAACRRLGCGKVATVSGRYYAMDRDRRWERVELAWNALVEGVSRHRSPDPVQAVADAYGRGETDEFIVPTVVVEHDQPVARIESGDVAIFFNFRADRARQLTRALTDPAFDGFVPKNRVELAEMVTFTRYDKEFALPVAFPPQELRRILGEEVSSQGLAQLRIAETEKYAHVTYFFNGGREEPFPGEDRLLVPSPKEVATYDLKPEMSAPEVTEKLLARIENNPYALVVLNFANGDMVGHSGVLPAAIKACETVDCCLGRIVPAFTAQGGVVLITADHGNAEMMIDPETGGPQTAHSSNPVPFVMVGAGIEHARLRTGGTLTWIAPTILELMGIPVPEEMESPSLIDSL